jgi:predicted RNase H-related nuclease YkuK (DUF458 family)
MKHLIEKNWTSGAGMNTDFYKILKLLKDYTLDGAKIFIGSDSFISSKTICFATAVCLYGGNLGGRYFFFKDFVPKSRFNNLVSRITEETRRSIEVANMLIEEYYFESRNIELHLDVSPLSAGNGTSKYSDMLSGYVQGYGVDFRLKPDAWASQTIADKHSK